MSNIADRLDRIEQKLDRVLAERPARTRAPIRFSSGRRPEFWIDDEVREWVLTHHRKMPVRLALIELTRLFGRERTPSRSAIGRVWQMMDGRSA